MIFPFGCGHPGQPGHSWVWVLALGWFRNVPLCPYLSSMSPNNHKKKGQDLLSTGVAWKLKWTGSTFTLISVCRLIPHHPQGHKLGVIITLHHQAENLPTGAESEDEGRKHLRESSETLSQPRVPQARLTHKGIRIFLTESTKVFLYFTFFPSLK